MDATDAEKALILFPQGSMVELNALSIRLIDQLLYAIVPKDTQLTLVKYYTSLCVTIINCYTARV